MAAGCDCGFELVDHFSYSHNLALFDNHLFPDIKEHLVDNL